MGLIYLGISLLVRSVDLQIGTLIGLWILDFSLGKVVRLHGLLKFSSPGYEWSTTVEASLFRPSLYLRFSQFGGVQHIGNKTDDRGGFAS